MEKLIDQFKNKTHILWDWNGTLLNDVDHCVTIINDLLAEHGLPSTNLETYRRRFRFPVQHYYEELGFNFGQTPFEKVVVRFMQLYSERIKECSLYKGAEELLVSLKSQGYSQSILSAAGEEGLLPLVNYYGIRPHFDHVYGLPHHHATSKVERGEALMKELKTDKKNIILVGDTDHDVEVAKALGIDIVLLADGHQHLERLTLAHSNVIPSRYSAP